MWLSSQDQVTRDSHRKLNGTTVDVTEKFRTSNGSAAHPGAFGDAREDINCRCAMRPVLDTEKRSLAEIQALHDTAHAAAAKTIAKSARTILRAQGEVCKVVLSRRLRARI
jgi:uncharacterized protein with gpF-like domain